MSVQNFGTLSTVLNICMPFRHYFLSCCEIVAALVGPNDLRTNNMSEASFGHFKRNFMVSKPRTPDCAEAMRDEPSGKLLLLMHPLGQGLTADGFVCRRRRE